MFLSFSRRHVLSSSKHEKIWSLALFLELTFLYLHDSLQDDSDSIDLRRRRRWDLSLSLTWKWRELPAEDRIFPFHSILRLSFVLLTASSSPSQLFLLTVSWLKFKLRSFIFRFLDLTHEEGRKRKGKERKAYTLRDHCLHPKIVQESQLSLCQLIHCVPSSSSPSSPDSRLWSRRESAWRKKQQAV